MNNPSTDHTLNPSFYTFPPTPTPTPSHYNRSTQSSPSPLTQSHFINSSTPTQPYNVNTSMSPTQSSLTQPCFDNFINTSTQLPIMDSYDAYLDTRNSMFVGAICVPNQAMVVHGSASNQPHCVPGQAPTPLNQSMSLPGPHYS